MWTNERYAEAGLALIQKIPTPIKPIQIDKESRHITFGISSIRRVPWIHIGAVQGIPVCFDAKESAVTTFPLQNIHEHQITFMEAFERQGGIAFILLDFTALQEVYYVPFRDILRWWNRGKNGGRKSFTYEELDQSYQVTVKNGTLIHYLEMLQKDLESRD